MHETDKEEEVVILGQDESNRSFDSVSMKSLTFNSSELVIFTRLESSTSLKRKE